MATTVASRKGKGRRLQQAVRDLLLENYNTLEIDDIISVPGGVSGEDLLLSPAARRLIPVSFEMKNQEKLNIWDALKQTAKNCGKNMPVLVFKRNHTKMYATLEMDDFMKMLIVY
jgi:hypothetical protein